MESQKHHERDLERITYPIPGNMCPYNTREQLKVCLFLFGSFCGLYQCEVIENFQTER